MYDGIKIECALIDPKKWDTSLELTGKFAESTGEVLPLPSEAMRRACKFSKTPTPNGHRYIFQGSIHRFFNNGGQNDNDYTFAQVRDTVKYLKQNYSINPALSKVHNFEFGVNIKLPAGMDAQAYQKYLISANNKAFEKLNPKRPAIGYIAEFNEFAIKIYDKGYHAKNGATDQIRVEIKVNRTRWLDQYGFNKGKDLLLRDLLNPNNIIILGNILKDKISSLILTPRQVDKKKLSTKQYETFLECRDARSWEEWTSRQRTRKRAQLTAIFKKLGQPEPVDILARLVVSKWAELTTSEVEPVTQKPREKVTISTIIVGGVRAILDLFKMYDYVYCKCFSFIVYLPRAIPSHVAMLPPRTLKGYRRWIDLNIRNDPIQPTRYNSLVGINNRRMKRIRDEPLWCKMYRKEVIKPKQTKRLTEQVGRTLASQVGFYQTKAWQLVRDKRRRANPLCQQCELKGWIRPMKIVDHIVPVDEAPELALNFENTQSLCNFCHDLKTKADTRAKKKRDKLKRGKILMRELEKPKHPGG